MTRPLRRDARVKNASCITGLRLEPEIAQALCDRACTDALEEVKPNSRRVPRGDVAQLARYYIRTGIGASAAAANRREEIGGFDACLAGLMMEPELCKQLATVAHQFDLTKAGAARHLIRLGLGYSDENSLHREAHFAELASSRQQTALGSHTQFRGTR